MGVIDRLRETLGVEGGEQSSEDLNLLKNALVGERETTIMLKERLLELELALEDEGWQRLGFEGEREFSRDGLGKIINHSRIMTLKNPLIQRAVEARGYYVWGQGVEIQARAKDVNEVIQAFIDDPKNQRELFSHQARILKDKKLHTDANIFFVLATTPVGDVNLRSIPVDEITDIIVNPDDRVDTWFYVREWNQKEFDKTTGKTTSKSKKAYYPDWLYALEMEGQRNKPKTIGGKPVHWDKPIYHVKVGGLDDMRFGVPEVYASLDWARAYKSYLEDWASLVRAISMFAWRYKTKRGKVAATRDKLAANFNEENGTRPPAGSFFVDSEEGDLIPINKSGAHTSAADGKMLRLMVASSMHLPDTILSNDPQQGALATAKTLDRPTELAMIDRQKLWAEVIKNILGYVIIKSVQSPIGSLRGTYTDGILTIDSSDATTQNPETIDVIFPPVVIPDMKELVDATIAALTLEGKQPANVAPVDIVRRLLLSALGVENVDEIVDQMKEEEISPGEDEEGAAVDAEESVNRFLEALQRHVYGG